MHAPPPKNKWISPGKTMLAVDIDFIMGIPVETANIET